MANPELTPLTSEAIHLESGRTEMSITYDGPYSQNQRVGLNEKTAKRWMIFSDVKGDIVVKTDNHIERQRSYHSLGSTLVATNNRRKFFGIENPFSFETEHYALENKPNGWQLTLKTQSIQDTIETGLSPYTKALNSAFKHGLTTLVVHDKGGWKTQELTRVLSSYGFTALHLITSIELAKEVNSETLSGYFYVMLPVAFITFITNVADTKDNDSFSRNLLQRPLETLFPRVQIEKPALATAYLYLWADPLIDSIP